MPVAIECIFATLHIGKVVALQYIAVQKRLAIAADCYLAVYGIMETPALGMLSQSLL